MCAGERIEEMLHAWKQNETCNEEQNEEREEWLRPHELIYRCARRRSRADFFRPRNKTTSVHIHLVSRNQQKTFKNIFE